MTPGTGHRSEQTVQKEPVCARQAMGWIQATPIFKGCSRRSTLGAQAEMHGVCTHITQAAAWGSIIGVPAASRKRPGAWTMALTGQAVMHSLQRVQP